MSAANIHQQGSAWNRHSPSGGLSSRIPLVRAVFGLSTIAVCAKIFGFAEKVVVAGFFGTGDTADVYFASMAIVLSIVFLVRELVYPSFLPVFAGSLAKPYSVPGALFRKMFFSAAAFLAPVVLIIVLFPEAVTRLLAPGFVGPKRDLTANLLRVLAPATFLLALMMVTYTTLNARKRFIRSALPEAALKLFVVLGLIVLVPILDIAALALVLGLGALGGLYVHLHFIPERRSLFQHRTRSDGGACFRKVLLLMGPLVVGVVFSHVSALVDYLLASTLPGGQLSYLGYSRKLIDAVLLVGPVAVVTVAYSELSHLASAGDYEKFTALVIKVFRVLVYLVVPGACILIGLRMPLVRCLFQRGRFDAGSTSGTSRAFVVYAFGLLTFSLEALFVHSFFALSDTKTPVKYGVLCVFLDIALAILLLKPFAYLGIAAALVVSKTVKIVILAAVLNKRLGGLFDSTMAGFLAKLTACTCTVWAVLKALLRVDNADSFLHAAAYDLVLPAVGALSVFALCSYLLRIEEFKAALSLLRHRKATVGTLYGEAQ